MNGFSMILAAALTFGICFLLDKGYTKLFRSRQQHRSGLAVRVNKRYATFGIILILLGVIALSGTLGVPFSWLRLSVIGALQYELNVAEIAAQSVGIGGLQVQNLTPEAFTTIALVMTVGILGGIICCIFFLKAYLNKLQAKPKAEPVQEDGDEKTNVSDNSEQSAPGSDGGWIRPPFSGEIADGRVWGRGSVDTKCSCMAFFQAVEELLQEGFVPAQDVYLSSSCTEEWGGPGCQAIIDELGIRGVRPWLVCDEGGGIYRHAHLIITENAHFENDGVFAAPIKTDKGWLDIIHGVATTAGGTYYSLGAMLLDLNEPWKIIGKTNSYILKPELENELHGNSDNTVFACGAIADYEKDQIRLYYGGCDQCINLAVGSLSELVEACELEL